MSNPFHKLVDIDGDGHKDVQVTDGQPASPSRDPPPLPLKVKREASETPAPPARWSSLEGFTNISLTEQSSPNSENTGDGIQPQRAAITPPVNSEQDQSKTRSFPVPPQASARSGQGRNYTRSAPVPPNPGAQSEQSDASNRQSASYKPENDFAKIHMGQECPRTTLYRGISAVAEQIKPLTPNEYQKFKDEGQHKMDRLKDALYISRLVEHLALTDARVVYGIENEEVSSIVETFMNSVKENLVRPNWKFDGQFHRCGSYYEGVKINDPNEFDYVYELQAFHSSFLKFKQKLFPKTFKPLKDEKVRPRAYVKLDFTDVPNQWKCRKCTNCRSSGRCTEATLDPRHVQKEFRDAIAVAVADSAGVQDLGQVQVTCSGPAVTLHMKLEKEAIQNYLNNKSDPVSSSGFGCIKTGIAKGVAQIRKLSTDHIFHIKIDISLAIPIENPNTSRFDVFAPEGIKLSLSDDVAEFFPIEKYHLVLSGDYWKASFSLLETKAVRGHLDQKNTRKRQCLQVLKHLRDKISVTGEHEADVLGTYPLKVAFLKECQDHQLYSDWGYREVAKRAINILQRVEREGQEGRLTSYVLEDEPILMESDKSYMESRRIQEYLEEKYLTFRLHGRIHTALLVLYWCFTVFLLSASSKYLHDYHTTDRELIGESGRVQEYARLMVGRYIMTLLPLTGFLITFSSIGLIFIVTYKCSVDTDELYSLYPSVPITYVTLLSMAVIYLFLGIWLAIGYQGGIMGYQIEGITIAFIVFTAIVVIVGIAHVVVIVTFMKGKIKHYRWEWVLPDQLWTNCVRDNCRCCLPRNYDTEVPNPGYLHHERTSVTVPQMDNPVYSTVT